MSKHTEGPWEWADGTHALVGPKIDDKPVWLRPVVLRSETGVKAEDARLIAAAPQLLEALQDLTLNVNEAMRTGGWVPTPLRSSFWAAMSDSLAAIAAATGAQAGESHE